MDSSSELERQFTIKLRGIYNEAAKFGYRPTYFLRMVEKLGGLNTARALLQKGVSKGLMRLAEEHRLDISMESLVLTEPWSSLFTDEEKAQAQSALDSVRF